MIGWSAEFMQLVIDKAPEGIVVCEARGGEQPVVYANEYFQEFTGYGAEELLGADLRRLQGDDRDQDGRNKLRRALRAGQAARALLRNYRKDGTPFLNDVLIEPVHGADGQLTHFLGFHRDAADRGQAEPPVVMPLAVPEVQPPLPAPAMIPTMGVVPAELAPTSAVEVPGAGLPRWLREDRLTGVFTREYFDEMLRLQWALGQRELRALTLLMFDIKALAHYNQTFGRSGGDAVIKRVGRLLAASFRRGADVVGRWEGGTFCVLAYSTEMTPTVAYAHTVAQRVLEQQIHFPRSARGRFLSVSVGAARLMPGTGVNADTLLALAQRALGASRAEPESRVMVASTGEDVTPEVRIDV
jgi:diguanylate cyclase (GGDEF)-like protein/PAS domain S-box-containing protein